MRKTLIAGSVLAVTALCGLSLIATRQNESSVRISSGPAKIDAASLALAKTLVAEPKGRTVMKAERADSTGSGNSNVEFNVKDLWNGVGEVYPLSDGCAYDKTTNTVSFVDSTYYLITGAAANEEGMLDFAWLSEGGKNYNFRGTITASGETTVYAGICYPNSNGSWQIYSNTIVSLDSTNNYSAPFSLFSTMSEDNAPMALYFQGSGSGADITVSDVFFGYEEKVLLSEAWSEEKDLPGLGVRDYGEGYIVTLEDGVTRLGVYYDRYNNGCRITGVNTTAESLTIPSVIKIDDSAYSTPANVSYLSMNDWSGAASLKNLYVEHSMEIDCNFEGSSLADLWIPAGTRIYSSNSGNRNICLHIPYGADRRDYTYYDFKRVLVGAETEEYPVSEYANWVIAGENDGEYFGIAAYNGYYTVCEVFSDNEAVALPETTPGPDGLYWVRGFGYDNNYSRLFCKNAPNLKSLVVPGNYAYANLNWGYYPITELHMLGDVPQTNWSVPSSITVYVGSQNFYANYEGNSSWNRGSLIPEGWDFEWMTVNVGRRGEFAQTYIEMTDADWSQGVLVKVTGKLNETDLQNMKELTHLRKLDLTEAEFDALPKNFMQYKTTLTDVVLPKNIWKMADYAFSGCSRLRSVVAPGATNVGQSAFQDCYMLTDFDISNVNKIYNSAFEDCHLFNPASLPEKLIVLGSYAFYNSGISKAVIPEGITKIEDRTFYSCKSLAEVVIPESVTTIGNYAFYNCTALNTLDIPEGVTGISSYAFQDCSSLVEISFPSTLQQMGSHALYGCSSLRSVTSKAIVPPVANNNFTSGMDLNHCSLFVAPFAIDAYRAANSWKDFYIMKALNEPVKNLYINRAMTFNLDSADNAVLQNNPDMTLACGNNLDNVGQLTANGDGTLSAGLFSIFHNMSWRDRNSGGYRYVYDYRSTLVNNAENMRADSVACTIKFEKNTWHFISFQYDVRVEDVKGLDGTDFVIRKYNSETRATGASNVSNWESVGADEVLTAGKGYIVQAANNTTNESGYVNDAVVVFPSRNTTTKNNLFASNNVIVPLEEYQAEFAHNRSWNLVGNPYPCYFDMHALQDDFIAPIVLWKRNAYQAYSPVDDDIILRPNESFFVQRPLDAEQMVFGTEGRMHCAEAINYTNNNSSVPGVYSAPAKVNSDRSVFNFNVEGAGSENRTRIVINEKASMEYETACDAAKFFAEESTGVEVYVNSGIRYDICERPLADGTATLGVKSGAADEYTISLTGRAYDGWQVLLTDNVTGTTVDLTATAYSFDLEVGDNDSRFTVLFKAPSASSVSDIEAAEGNVPVRVVTLAGITVYEGPVADFTAPAGIYVVLGAEKAYKVVLK